MGIFSNRNTQDVPVADEGSFQDPAAQPVQDNGMLPQPGDQQNQEYGAFATTTAPPMDDPSASASDYIMTGDQGTPAPQQHAIQPQIQDSPGEPVPVHTNPPAPVAITPVPNDLMQIKQQALQQLSPLISHLEQSPEERYRTAMMMLQATDDQTLIKTAYEAAQAITDEKAKAQALFDIVNEINYFSQRS